MANETERELKHALRENEVLSRKLFNAQVENENLKARIEELEAWKLAVDHRLVSVGTYNTPAEAVDALIRQEKANALRWQSVW